MAIKDQMIAGGANPAFGHGSAAAATPESPASGNAELDKTFQAITSMLSEEMVKKIGGVFNFDLKGKYSLLHYVSVAIIKYNINNISLMYDSWTSLGILDFKNGVF